MTTTSDKPRALSSENGKDWQQSGPDRDCEWPSTPDSTVVKLVLGTLGDAKDGDNWTEVLPILASGLKDHFPNLTHLHLWGLPMEKLGPLPEGLEALDIRKCSQLSHLPELPDTLETLDLAECIALNNLPKQGIASLRWFHVDGCVGIPSNRISSFLEDCRDMEEFTAKGCSHLVELTLPPQESTPPDGTWHPQFPPRRLKKLVLEGCSSLTKLPDLSVYPWLHHLNLNKCSALELIQSLPAGWTVEGDYEVGIRYLLTEGCERLHTFCDLDVRKIHLSVTGEDNVARVWRTMKRLSGDKGEMIMSKLLLLGSGRCGKTTISKAIRGENVRLDEDSTRNIQFYQWDTDFQFRSGEAKAGTVHIWDFGGQEIYHNTHRLFASEGSVFIIATTDPDTHKARLKKELDAISDKGEKAFYERENEYRELKYWLDYLRSALGLASIDDLKSSKGKVSILVVHTGSGGEETARKYLRRQAGPYAELLDHDIRIVAVDFHAKSSAEPTRLILSWLREALGGAADRYGMKVPELFSKVAQRIARELRESSLDRMFLNFEAWTALVTEQTPELDVFNDQLRRKIQIEQADAVATYLHRCGIIFKLKKSKGGYEVMVNQKWGIETIYTLTTNKVATSMKAYTQRTFGGERLREIMNYHSVKWLEMSPERCDLVLELLDQCDVCVRLWADDWIAIQKELLPDNGDKIATEMARMWESTAATYPGLVNHSFALHGDQGSMLGDSDFRKVLAYFAREQMGKILDCLLPESGKQRQDYEPGYHQRSRGADLCLWSNGFQIFLEADIEGKKSTAVVRVEWKPCGEGSFEGGLFVQILCFDDDDSGKRFQDLLFGDGGPLAIFKGRYEKSDTRAPDLSQEELPRLRGFGQPGWVRKDGPVHKALRHDIALSYRSNDKAIAEAIVGRFKALGRITEKDMPRRLLVYHYAEDELLKLGDDVRESQVTKIYDFLNNARVLIVIASDSYFETPDLDGKTNLYCPVELAEAICSTHRRFEQFFWVYAGTVSNSNIERILIGNRPAVEGFIDSYYKRVTEPRLPMDLRNDHRSEIDKRECRAIVDCTDSQITQFLNAACRNEKQSVTAREGSESWLDELQRKVLNALAADTPGEGL